VASAFLRRLFSRAFFQMKGVARLSARMLMARFNAILLEQNALKREKIERRRGPKPVRASLLWAQTQWLESPVALCEGRVCFASNGRSWNFDGALLESTKRALDKLSYRSLPRDESERLANRKRKWAWWRECASLENLEFADLRARLVLESLLTMLLDPSPAREVAALPLPVQAALLRELEGEFFPPATRELARWVSRNRDTCFWRENPDFPVHLACRLGFEGDAMPPVLCGEGFALDSPALASLLETREPERVREIAEFWANARWEWPCVRSLCLPLKTKEASALKRAWRKLEGEWRAKWLELWREVASRDLDAARAALDFHGLLVDANLARFRESIHKAATRAGLLEWFDGRNRDALDTMQSLCKHENAAPLIELWSELWIEWSDVQTKGFWNEVAEPTLQAAQLIGAPAAREMRGAKQLHLASRFRLKPELLELAREWIARGDGDCWTWQLARLPSSACSAASLRRELAAFFAVCERFPAMDAASRAALWDTVLTDDAKRAFDPAYWRFIRLLTPLFLEKSFAWHQENSANLYDWLVLWAELAVDFGWEEAEAVAFCERILLSIERECDVLTKAPERLNRVEMPLEIFVRLSHGIGEPSERAAERCVELLRWLLHGQEKRTKEWWGALSTSQKLEHRPRFCAALLRVSARFPAAVREVLTQFESLQNARLTDEFDSLEDIAPVLDGELRVLGIQYPSLEDELSLLNEWQRRMEVAPHVPSGVCAILEQENKWRREGEFLRARLEQAPDAHLQKRLFNLEARLETGAGDIEAELRVASETAVELAISEGLRLMISRALRGRLRFLCGAVVDTLEWSDDWANALLLACETHSNRKWATKLLRGQSQNSPGWQRFIPANARWLDEFAASGKNREVFEAPRSARIGQWEVWIERDALQILQMGNRFSTCLSRGGCNAHSTIANALDANKLVVYARRDGHIQARQLWAVTAENQLGGFEIYANLSQTARDKSGVGAAFHEFASHFARDCGMELNEDTAADIPTTCGALWYDDGLISWADLLQTDKEEVEDAPDAPPLAPHPVTYKISRDGTSLGSCPLWAGDAYENASPSLRKRASLKRTLPPVRSTRLLLEMDSL